jgi:hypothetical protein
MLRLVPPASSDAPQSPNPEAATRAVAGAVALVLSGTTRQDLVTGSLVLPLALSVCMERHGVGPDGLVGAMRLLRSAVLADAGLDAASEPVPLAAGDPRSAVVALARYLHGLLERAASVLGCGPDAVASSAAARLRLG